MNQTGARELEFLDSGFRRNDGLGAVIKPLNCNATSRGGSCTRPYVCLAGRWGWGYLLNHMALTRTLGSRRGSQFSLGLTA